MCKARMRSHAQFGQYRVYRSTLAVTWVLIGTLLLTGGGCCNPKSTIQFDLLHQEMRQMEDYVYHLENELEEKRQTLARYREKQSDSQTTDIPPNEEFDETKNEELRIPSVTIDPENEDIPNPDDSTSNDVFPRLEPPTVTKPDKLFSPSGTIQKSVATNTKNIEHGFDHRQVDAQVTHVLLNRRLTGGHNFDAAPGDDGLTIVLEPRNADGRFVPLPGPISIALLDPLETGDEACVARWDIDQVEVEQSLFVSGPDRGIHLDLSWPKEPPQQSRLHLFTRYQTVDGRHLDVDQPVTITRPGELSNRWTPSTRFSRRQQQPAHANHNLVDDIYGRKLDKKSASEPTLPKIVQEDSTWPAPKSHRSPSPPKKINGPTSRVGKIASQSKATPRWKPYR